MASKFPNLRDIAWGKIREVKVTSDSENDSYGFEFELYGRKQRMTISISPGSTSYMISAEDGSPLLYGVQKGQEFRVIDFSSKPTLGGQRMQLRKMGKIAKAK